MLLHQYLILEVQNNPNTTLSLRDRSNIAEKLALYVGVFSRCLPELRYVRF
jgi:hypothetical protein